MSTQPPTNHRPNFTHMQRAMFPTALVLSSLSAFLCAMVFVVPRYEKIYADFGTELPVITKSILNLSRWLGGRLTPDQWVPGLIWVVVAMVGVVIWQVNRKVLRNSPGEDAGEPLSNRLSDQAIADHLTRQGQDSEGAALSLTLGWFSAGLITTASIVYIVVGLFLPFLKITTALT